MGTSMTDHYAVTRNRLKPEKLKKKQNRFHGWCGDCNIQSCTKSFGIQVIFMNNHQSHSEFFATIGKTECDDTCG
jgi:hypothetical protein